MRQATIVLLAAALISTPVAAEPPDSDKAAVDQRVDTMIATAKQVYGVEQARRGCQASAPDEIVVCVDRPTDQRVPSTADTDPYSRAARKALDGNIPSAPDISFIKCRRGRDGVCRGNLGGDPEPAYYLDVTALPTPPEGSDADKIAKGEAPAP